MKSTKNADLHQSLADAAQWRELVTLLQQKAYKAMSPEEISEAFPDLRQVYRTVQHQHNGSVNGTSHIS